MAQIIKTAMANSVSRVPGPLPKTPHLLIHRPLCLSTTNAGVNTLGDAHYYYIQQSNQNGNISNNIGNNSGDQKLVFNQNSSVDVSGSVDEGYFSELLSSPRSDSEHLSAPNTPSVSSPSYFPSPCSSSVVPADDSGLLAGHVSSAPVFFIGSPPEVHEPILSSNCSLLEDLDSTLNAVVERNLEIHLRSSSVTSAEGSLLPQIELSADENDILQFELELPDAIEVQETVEAASVIPFSPASKTSLELSPNHENDFSVPSVFPSFCPFVENLESPVTDESSLGVPDDSPLFFIPEAENEEESAMVEDLSEEMCLDETFEVGLESVGSIDGYIGDQCLQMTSPSTQSLSESSSSSSLGSSVNSPSVSSFRLVRICPSVTSPNNSQLTMTSINRRLPTVTSPNLGVMTSPNLGITMSPNLGTITSPNRPTVTSPGLSTMTSSDEEPSCSKSASAAMPRYLQIVRDPGKKKTQNREASRRYRKKKKTEVASLEQTVAELRLRKKELMDRIEGKRKEASVLKNLLFEMDM